MMYQVNSVSRRAPSPKRDAGYALLLIIFLLAVVTVWATVIAQNVFTNGQRDREEEMIWRGRQYVRGVKLYVRYYQTHGGAVRFPTSLDDLTKAKPGIRFMRQAYKDPMNVVDGSWRFIYVGPNGQLIGSLKDHSLNAAGQTNGLAPGGSPTGAGANGFGSPSSGGSSFGGSSFGSSSFGSGSSTSGSSFGGSSFGSSSFGNSNGTGTSSTTTQGGESSDPHSITGDDGATVIGGNIIGVGSKINKPSVIWYDKAKNYRQFEFIWDPSKEPLLGGVAPTVPPSNGGLFPNQNNTQNNSSFGSSNSGNSFGQQSNPTSPTQPTGGTNPSQP